MSEKNDFTRSMRLVQLGEQLAQDWRREGRSYEQLLEWLERNSTNLVQICEDRYGA